MAITPLNTPGLFAATSSASIVGAAWPDAQYWGGQASQLKRQTKPNGEQQIYVDPRYAGLAARWAGVCRGLAVRRHR